MRHVAILVETARAYGRGVIRGIARYNRQSRWSIYYRPQGLGDPPPPWLRRWKGDGIIARIDNVATAQAVAEAGVPVVNLRSTLPGLPFPFIGADNRAVARMVFDHLRQRAFQYFGFCGFPYGFHQGFDTRLDHLRHLLNQSGFVLHEFVLRRGLLRPPSWEREQDRIAQWLKSLPHPIGIITVNDDCGLQVLDACRRIGIAVPDQVAVLGCENDEYVCSLSIPPLSSVDLNSERAGFEAAVILDRMMSGRPLPKQLPKIKPLGIVERHSTDVLAVHDQQVVQAVRFIRQNACRPITVMDVARQTHGGLLANQLYPTHEEPYRVCTPRMGTGDSQTDRNL